MFDCLGLTRSAAELYERLLAEYSIPLPTDHGLCASDIEMLIECGLALRMPDDYARNPEGHERRLVPVLPDESLVGLLDAEEQRINAEREALLKARRDFQEVRHLLDAARAAPGQSDFELLHGIDEVSAAYTSVCRSAQRDLSLFDIACFDHVPEEGKVTEVPGERVEAGLSFRAIYDHTVFTEYPHYMQQVLAESRARGEVQRVVPVLPCKMILADESLALVALTKSGSQLAVLVRSERLVSALRGVFETLWAEASPLAGEPEDPSPGHPYGHIPSLLGAGLGDDAIARQLEMGLRTVRRRVAEMADELGAQSRFQAGVLAERRGYIRSAKAGT